MEEYKIIIASVAKRDLGDVIEYLNTQSPEAALRQYDHIIEKISSLSEMPERCPLLKDPHLREKGYRMLIINNYLVFYVVKKNTIHIRRILWLKTLRLPALSQQAIRRTVPLIAQDRLQQILAKMAQRVPGIVSVEAAETADGRVVLRFQDGDFINRG
jgi:plasmid stabilization system protein ParE